MADDEPTGNLEVVSPEQKLKAVDLILPVISDREDFMISGSLALKIAGKVQNGGITLTAEDMTEIHDLDIIKAGFKMDDIKLSAEAVTAATGFSVEPSPGFYNCLYEDSGVRNLAIAEAEVEVEGSNLASKRKVQYTTPEFALLSLANQKVTDKTPPEKYKRKVVDIQSHPQFSKERFKALAANELNAGYALNESTFEVWKRNVFEKGEDVSLEIEFEEVKSLIDPVRFANAVKSPEDLKGLPYYEVRFIPYLEQFLSEMDQEEV